MLYTYTYMATPGTNIYTLKWTTLDIEARDLKSDCIMGFDAFKVFKDMERRGESTRIVRGVGDFGDAWEDTYEISA